MRRIRYFKRLDDRVRYLRSEGHHRRLDSGWRLSLFDEGLSDGATTLPLLAIRSGAVLRDECHLAGGGAV